MDNLLSATGSAARSGTRRPIARSSSRQGRSTGSKLLELSGIGDPEGSSKPMASRCAMPYPAWAGSWRTTSRSGRCSASRARAPSTRRPTLVRQNEHGGRMPLRRSGPLSMAPSQLGIFSRCDPMVLTPDIEYHVQPLSTGRLGSRSMPGRRRPSVCNLRPESRGPATSVATIRPTSRLSGPTT